MKTAATLIYRAATLEEIITLREEVIIRGTNRSEPYFEGDRDPTTRHFGAFEGDRTVGCLTFLPRVWKGEPAWQLRGMATHPEYQLTGIGAGLLAFAERSLLAEGPLRLFWCNARTPATGFYVKQGWRIASEEFPVEGVGPHFKMVKDL